MTQKQSRVWSWSMVGAIVLVGSIVWRSSAIASEVDSNTGDILDIGTIVATVVVTTAEHDAKLDETGRKFEEIDKRLDDLEHMEEMIEDIHAAVVEGG